MASSAELIAARARALLGAPFRLQGRSARGTDCVGVVVHALGLGPEAVPRDYSLRGGSMAQLAAALRAQRLRQCAGGRRPSPGDVLVFRTGAQQLHLAVSTGDAFVHADAGLRRVVERPLPAPWPCLARWRVSDPGDR